MVGGEADDTDCFNDFSGFVSACARVFKLFLQIHGTA